MRLVLLFYFVFFLSVFSIAQNTKMKIAPEPSWITHNNLDYTSTYGIAEAEDGYLNLAYEQQVSLSQQTIYTRKRLKILAEPGLENVSEVSVNFDPSYQLLLFHSIRVIRNQHSFNRLQPSKIKIIQQETDLSKHLYDGSLTAFLTLEDLQVGDIVEYSYSLKGFNPLAGKYASCFDLQFTVPMAHLYYKLAVPADRVMSFRHYLSSLQPVVSTTGTEKIYEWKQENLAPLRIATQMPDWQDPYPCVFISEYRSWNEVVNWALPLYAQKLSVASTVSEKVTAIKQYNSQPEKQILAAIRFVQDEIRYMGEEAGVNSHQPHHPEKIIKQRFGDCKDKSYLLCTLLNGLGIEAFPVLINTSHKKAITNWLPSPFAFDHVTVQIVWNGKTYWIDPTISGQRGSLADLSYPDYQVGLVIKPGANDLTTIPLQDKGQVRVKEYFNLTDMSGKAYFSVTSNYTGSHADNIRDYFKNSSVYEIQKKYREFYATYFDQLKADSLRYEDDPATGTFITKEFYTISEMWESKGLRRSINFAPYIINSIFSKPKESKEALFYAQTHPAHYTETIEVNLPEDWGDDTSPDEEIANSCFRYAIRYSGSNRHNVITYEYETFKDFIAANEWKGFVKDYTKINAISGYEFYKDGDAKNGLSNLATSASPAEAYDNILDTCYIVLAICVGVTIVKRRNKRHS